MSDRFATTLKRPEQLVDYLSSTYEVSEERAQEIINQSEHKDVIDRGINVASFVYYVGDQIADAEGLELVEPEVEEDDE